MYIYCWGMPPIFPFMFRIFVTWDYALSKCSGESVQPPPAKVLMCISLTFSTKQNRHSAKM
jgi:hypothetical protein